MTQSADRKLMTNEEWTAFIMKLEAFWEWSRLIDKEHFEDDYYGRSVNVDDTLR